MQANTLDNQPISFLVNNGNIFVNGAAVVTANVQAQNGVVHIIDTVLTPPGFVPPTSPSSNPSSSTPGLSAGAIAGIAVGGTVGAVMIGGAVYYFFFSRAANVGVYKPLLWK